jgi:serine/threonine-protein kinase HipA
LPSYRALADLLNQHSSSPGLDRLAGAQAAIFHFLVGNADAHAKDISLMHLRDDVRLAPLYDVVSTAAYPDLSTELALSIGDELNPDAIKSAHWSDLAFDFGLNAGAFERARRQLAETVATEAPKLRTRRVPTAGTTRVSRRSSMSSRPAARAWRKRDSSVPSR